MIPNFEPLPLPVPVGPSPVVSNADLNGMYIDAEDGSIPLSHYLWTIRRHALKIVGFIVASLVLTYVASSRFKPIFEATAAINIDRAAPSGVVGAEALKSVNVAQDVDPYIATQIKIIQSDSVLRSVANRYDLLKREGQLDKLTNDKVRQLQAAPIMLRNLRVSRPPNTYFVQVSYRSHDPHLSADVANAIARSYLEHIYRIQISSSTSAAGFMEKQLDELKAKMERSGQALARFEKDLNVINPEEKTNIISSRLLQLNTEYTNAQADRVKKEAIFRGLQSNSIAATQVSGQGEDLVKIQEKINEAQERFAEIKTSKGSSHPEFKRAESQLVQLGVQYEAARLNAIQKIQADFNQAANRERMLRDALASTKTEFDQLNARSFEYQSLKQEAEADRKLYEELVTKLREASINAGFENKNTAIADPARPTVKPVFPNTKLNLLLAGVLSLLLGIGTVLIMDSIDTTVRQPEDVHRLFHTDLIGTLPMIRDTRVLLSDTKLIRGNSDYVDKKSKESTQALNSFEEAVRMVRNAILLTDSDRRLKSLLFTSATPGEGKSTTALYLALAHAEQGRSTLLIDADLRRPTLHKKLQMGTSVGLSNVLMGECDWQKAVTTVGNVDNLSLLPAGPPSRRAADLVGSGISRILDEAARSYDLIIVDGPPLLGFAEPMQLATAADGVVVIAVAGETNRKAIAASISTLQRLKANVIGLVLNRTTKEHGSGYYYYYYQDRYYKAA